MGNTDLAEMINNSPAREEDKLKVSPQDIGQQWVAMKKAQGGAAEAAKPARRRTRTTSESAASSELRPLASPTAGTATAFSADRRGVWVRQAVRRDGGAEAAGGVPF